MSSFYWVSERQSDKAYAFLSCFQTAQRLYTDHVGLMRFTFKCLRSMYMLQEVKLKHKYITSQMMGQNLEL